MRYNHWFWHSSFMNQVEKMTVKFSSYLWRKRWGAKESYKVGQKNLEVA